MLALIVGILSALLFGWLAWFVFGFGPILVGLFTVFGFLLAMIPLNLWLKRRMEKIFAEVQGVIERDQQKMRRQVSQLQGRMQGSPKGIQKQLEKQQTASIREALKVLDQITPLYKWNVLAKKQAHTLRGQLLFQIKDFENADRYLEQGMNVDPMTVAMKMARLYQKNQAEAAEKLYRKVKRRFKGDKGIVLHCLHAWILIKKDRADEALQFLTDLKEKTDHQVVRDNWEHLANGRVRSFSNAGLGELWYALHLEQPKTARVKQYGGGRRR